MNANQYFNLQPFQKKVLLNFLGVKLEEIPTAIKECNESLGILYRKDKEVFTKAFDIVVNQKMPEGNKIGTEVKFEDLAKIMRNEVANQEKDTIGRISEKYAQLSRELKNEISNDAGKALESLISELKSAIERESKKYNKVILEVKMGNSKAREVKGVVPEEFPKLLQLASSRINTLMVGPSGCGKTFIAEKVAEALGLRFATQSCSAGVSESAFTGWLIPVGDKGKFEYVQSAFVDCYENGGVFLFDEIDASDPNVLVFMNAALANNAFSLPQRHNNPVVKKHKDFVAIAAANTYGSGADGLYHGRNALDESTLDRFRVGTVKMDYSKVVEEKLFESEVLEWGRKIRAGIAQHKLRRIMSTRTMKDAQEMRMVHKWEWSEIESGYFASWSKEEVQMIRRGF